MSQWEYLHFSTTLYKLWRDRRVWGGQLMVSMCWPYCLACWVFLWFVSSRLFYGFQSKLFRRFALLWCAVPQYFFASVEQNLCYIRVESSITKKNLKKKVKFARAEGLLVLHCCHLEYICIFIFCLGASGYSAFKDCIFLCFGRVSQIKAQNIEYISESKGGEHYEPTII